MRSNTDIKIFIGILVSSVILVILAVFLLNNQTKTIAVPVDGKIHLIEFSDFQCPACKAYQPYVDQIVQKYPDKVVFEYKHFPLPQHQYAFKAAEAAEAAREQGKFYQMYKHLFDNQDKLSDEFITNSGKEMGLDQQKYSDFSDEVARDLAEGKGLGVNSTPTFFLNGKKLNLKSFDDLEKAIQAEF